MIIFIFYGFHSARHEGAKLEAWWPDPIDVGATWEDWRWHESSRWSRRQGNRVDLSGFTGELQLKGDLTRWAGLLAALDWTGVGRGGSCGRGAVKVDWSSQDRSFP